MTRNGLLGTVAAIAGIAALLYFERTRPLRPRVEPGARRIARNLAVGALTGAVVLGGLAPLHADAPTLFDGLTSRAAPLIAVSALAGVATLWLLWQRSYPLARLTAVVAVASVVLGWGVGQYPWLLVDEVRIEDAAGAPATLTGLLVAVGLAGVIVVPALGYLFWLTQTERWTRH